MEMNHKMKILTVAFMLLFKYLDTLPKLYCNCYVIIHAHMLHTTVMIVVTRALRPPWPRQLITPILPGFPTWKVSKPPVLMTRHLDYHPSAMVVSWWIVAFLSIK